MPYVSCDGNRYIGEHSCSHHHYGNQSLVRPCCVEDAKARKAQVLRVAITTQHPAYTIFRHAYESLTDAEQDLVGDLVPVYQHGPAGFKERN